MNRFQLLRQINKKFYRQWLCTASQPSEGVWHRRNAHARSRVSKMCKELQFQHVDYSYCDATVGLDQTLKIASLTQAIDKVPRKKKNYFAKS